MSSLQYLAQLANFMPQPEGYFFHEVFMIPPCVFPLQCVLLASWYLSSFIDAACLSSMLDFILCIVRYHSFLLTVESLVLNTEQVFKKMQFLYFKIIDMTTRAAT